MSSLGAVECAAGLLCTPKSADSIPGLGDARWPVCRYGNGVYEFEGRCMPRCFTIRDASLEIFGEGDCPIDLAQQLGLLVEEIACMPCYDPITGASTGACTLFGDAPVGPAPELFRECGSHLAGPTLGHCVPAELMARAGRPGPLGIPQDKCTTGEVCAPNIKLDDPDACFAKCQSPIGGDAACVPTYILEAPGSPGQGLSSVLRQVTCAAGETCVPCVNPLDGSETGACFW